MTAAISPRFAQHKHSILLTFLQQRTPSWSTSHCEMKVLDVMVDKVILETTDWDTINKRQIGITCNEGFSETRALLYVLQAKEGGDFKRYYILNEEQEQEKGGQAAYYRAECIGLRDSRSKNDLLSNTVEFSACH